MNAMCKVLMVGLCLSATLVQGSDEGGNNEEHLEQLARSHGIVESDLITFNGFAFSDADSLRNSFSSWADKDKKKCFFLAEWIAYRFPELLKIDSFKEIAQCCGVTEKDLTIFKVIAGLNKALWIPRAELWAGEDQNKWSFLAQLASFSKDAVGEEHRSAAEGGGVGAAAEGVVGLLLDQGTSSAYAQAGLDIDRYLSPLTRDDSDDDDSTPVAEPTTNQPAVDYAVVGGALAELFSPLTGDDSDDDDSTPVAEPTTNSRAADYVVAGRPTQRRCCTIS